MPPQAPLFPAADNANANDNSNVHDFTGTMQLIENSHIVPNSCNTYHCSLTNFMLWLFVNKVHKLVNSEELDLEKISDGAR